MKAQVIGTCTLLVVLAACGGTQEEAKAPAPAQPTRDDVDHAPKAQVSQELGSIDPQAADRVFQAVVPQISTCQKNGLKRLEYLAGDVKFFLRIDQNGKVRWAYVEQSTLGDRQTEKCMLDALSYAQWPRPEGGEAEVQKGLSFDAGDAREPTPWSPEKVSGAIEKHEGEIRKCKGSVQGTFHATAYVEPEGKGGKVAGVGVAPPNKDGEEKVDCLVDALKSMKVPSPGSYAAKVSFDL